jgi:hypothetical protein
VVLLSRDHRDREIERERIDLAVRHALPVDGHLGDAAVRGDVAAAVRRPHHVDLLGGAERGGVRDLVVEGGVVQVEVAADGAVHLEVAIEMRLLPQPPPT